MKIVKKLYQYACLYKKLIIAALIMLSISVAADLTGPFIAKKVIDSHILGIESPWYETAKSKDAVSYQDTWYKRGSYFSDNEQKGQEIRILQTGTKFVFVDELVPFEGKRTLTGSTLNVTKDNETTEYEASILSKRELMAFYQPEISRIAYFWPFTSA